MPARNSTTAPAQSKPAPELPAASDAAKSYTRDYTRGKAKKAPPIKPAKPFADFPLFPHASGYWAKKILGKMHYFGPWADPDAALEKYLAGKERLHSGRKARETTDGVTVKELANRFLNAKQTLVDGGELSPRTWTDYHGACQDVITAFGKARLVADLDTDDFAKLRTKLAKTCGPHRLGKIIQCVRCLFKFAYDAALIAAPIRFGPGFKRPSKKTLRLHRAAQGAKLFTPEEVRALLAIASPQVKAMILLGINAGFGNSDVGNLPLSVVDLDAGWIDYARPKTGVPRRACLWPETVEAIRDALAKRPTPKSTGDAGLVFITRYGESWTKDVADSPVSKELRKLLNAAGIKGHRNFYTLRHTFRTIADATKDQPAIDYIMGHEAPGMASLYRETIGDDRLRAIAEYVRTWLFAEKSIAE